MIPSIPSQKQVFLQLQTSLADKKVDTTGERDLLTTKIDRWFLPRGERMPDVIDTTYLPFTCDELIPHFIADVDGQLAYFQESASRYHEFMDGHLETAGVPITQARIPRQIEKDERFWTITATKHIFDDPLRNSMLVQLLDNTYGSIPPIPSLSSWEECLEGDLRLYFETFFCNRILQQPSS